MSDFSNLLNTYIEEQGVKIYSLAQYCKIDRSALYRFIKGTRIPSELSVVHRIADYLKLTSQQKACFYEAWEIANTGEALWYQRKATEHFLLNIPKTDTILPQHPWNFTKEFFTSSKNTFVLKSKEEILTSLEAMLIQESTSEKPKLMLLLQPEHMDLADLLLRDPHSGNFDICNIICLNNHDTPQNISSYNIKCLETLLSLHVHQKGFYSQYYYDNVTTHFHSISLMPCMILTSNSAITCSADLSFGIIHTSPAVVAMLEDIFRKYKASSHPLANKIRWSTQEFKDQIQYFTSRESILLSSEPYICSWLSSEILQKYLTEESMKNKEIISAFSFYLSSWKEYAEASELIWYTTHSSLEYFMATGQISFLPKGLMHPLSYHDRQLYMDYLYSQAKNHPIYLIKGPLEHIGNHFQLYVNAQTVFLTFQDSRYSLSGLRVSESNLVDSLYDLFTYIKESDQLTQQLEQITN